MAHHVRRAMLGLCSVLDNTGPSRPAPRDGSGANDPQRKSRSLFDDLIGAGEQRGRHVDAPLRLMTNSYLVGACTGRSAGLTPLRMRPGSSPVWFSTGCHEATQERYCFNSRMSVHVRFLN
jgi:hypothetical protein